MPVPAGLSILLAVAVLVFLGAAERVLDRLGLSDKSALAFLFLMVAGTFITIPVARGPSGISVNVGGAIIPFILALWVLAHADTPGEWVRAIAASAVTAGVLYWMTKNFRFEEGHTFVDPMYLYGVIAGAAAYLVGRSRKAAFAAGVLGVLFLDVAHTVEVLLGRTMGRTDVGGAGVFDAVVISGVIAVGLAEVLGETLERVRGGHPVDKEKAIVRPEADRAARENRERADSDDE